MKKLETLKLNYSEWVDDEVIMSVKSQKITILLIQKTNITNKGL